MAQATDKKALNVYARLAGFLFLFYIVVYLPGSLIMGSYHVAGDFAQTAANIRGSQTLYRTSLVLQLLGGMTALPLGWAFYALLKQVDKNLALLALLWRVGEAIIGGLAAVFRFMALSLFTGGSATLAPEGQQALASLLLSGPRATFPIAVIYFSIGSAIFFKLLLRSRAIPRLLAAVGVLGSMLATFLGFAMLVFPAQSGALVWFWGPMLVAEVGTALWLLIRGADFGHWNARSAALGARNSASSAQPHID
jgi:Domain of unknown function (DUF4386)